MSLKQGTGIKLRPWADKDLPLLERLMGDPLMTRYLGGPETPEKIRERHRRYCRSSESDAGRMFVVLHGSNDSAIGSVGFWEREWRGKTVWETGWSILPEFQGQGLATEATSAVIERVRKAGGHRTIHAFPSVQNAPSNAICRKLEFHLIGEVEIEYPPGHVMRCNDWSLVLQSVSTEQDRPV